MTKRSSSLSMTPPSTKKPTPAADKKGRIANEAKALSDGIKRLTVDMPTAAHRALKKQSAEHDKPMNDIVLEALRKWGLEWE